jgi:MerR family Zn(II)-responsive transcriptional regulator of zntA
MRIGELARECNVNPRTVRFYEAFGLLPKAARAPSGHRMYSDRDLQRLRFIRRAKQIGLPLANIRQIATFADTGSCEHLRPRLKELIAAQLSEIESRIKDLRALQRELQGHYASLCQPQAPRSGADCSCLDRAPHKTPILQTAALVKRPPRRKNLTGRR